MESAMILTTEGLWRGTGMATPVSIEKKIFMFD